MKTLRLIDNLQRDGVTYETKHDYNAPYERNDLYLQMVDEQTPASPDAALQPEMGKMLHADVDFEYNYMSPLFELFGKEAYRNSDEFLLPSLNAWLVHEEGLLEGDIFNSMFTRYLNNQGDTLSPSLVLNKDFFELTNKSYAMISMMPNDLKSSITQSLREWSNYDIPFFVDKRMTKIFADSENKREMFPIFAKLRLSGVQKNQFCNLLEEHKLEHEFIDFFQMHASRSDNRVRYEHNGEIVHEQNTRFSGIGVFLTHLNLGHSGNVKTYEDEESTCSIFESFIKKQIFESKLNEYLNNEPDGEYPIAFKVYKYGDDTEPSHIRYFFNYQDITDFFLYDTQVAYDGYYTYDIKVINGIKRGKTLVFLEEPYYREAMKIKDSPPIEPDVEMVAYRGIDNKVLIMLNQMIDKKAMVPIPMREGDEQKFLEHYEAQKILPPKPIIFESDDPTNFEMFRTTKKPTSYSDFHEDGYRFIGSNMMTSAAYEDTIVPNQTYYYTFRALDVHLNVSNPTPVYEFTLIKEGETLYPKIRIVEFERPEPPAQKTRTFKRYMKIGLAPSQYQIPNEVLNNMNSVLSSQIPIGVSEDNIVLPKDTPEKELRRFKFRIRSKNTGKLIDINVTFKKNRVIQA